MTFKYTAAVAVLLAAPSLAFAHSGAGASGQIDAGSGDYASEGGHDAVNDAPGNDGKPASVSHPSTDFDTGLISRNPKRN